MLATDGGALSGRSPRTRGAQPPAVLRLALRPRRAAARTASWGEASEGGRSPPPSVLAHPRDEDVAAPLIGRLPLRRVAVDQRPQEHRVGEAADLVLDGEERPARLGIDDVLEPVLDLARLLGDEPVLLQERVG